MSRKLILLLVFLFLLALIPRVLFILVYSRPIEIPAWYGDVFHHWQIAYLSKEIGFSKGFLRLWDLKGMEYLWGLMHPLVLVMLFYLTGSISILIPRLLSVVCGSANVVLLYLILKREFNWQTGITAAILTSFLPINLFSNTIGMQEELGMFFIFLGILTWPKKPFFTGLFFALASMTRAEYWLFAVGLVSVLMVKAKNFDKKIILATSFFFLILLYGKYLDSWTGNAIYPVYWNYMASVKGEWFEGLPVVGLKFVAQQINRVIFLFGLVGGLLTFFKKPRGFLLLLFGFSNIVFIGFMIGFSAYVKGFVQRIWIDRLYNWPYLFSLILVLIVLFWVLPRKVRLMRKLKVNWLIFLGMLFLSWQMWQPINFFWDREGRFGYDVEKEQAGMIAKYYQEKNILLPENRQTLTYFLAHDFDIKGRFIRGQLFDPFYYTKVNPLENWQEFRVDLKDWLLKEEITLLYLSKAEHYELYQEAVRREPEWFKLLEEKKGEKVYQVNLGGG